MFRNALIGIDEIDGGRDPVQLARKLCEPDGRLTLARVYAASRPSGVPAAPQHNPQVRRAEIALRRAARVSGVTDTASIGAASVGNGLGRLVTERRPDLLVIGSGHRGPEGFVEVRDWLAETLTRSACAIAIAPLGYRHNAKPLRTVGVAFNRSAESRHALLVAKRVAARQSGAELEVREVATEASGGEDHAIQIAEELSDFSSQVDLLVLGPRGAGPLRRLMHPSATLSLVHCAESPLLLINPRVRTSVADGGYQLPTPATPESVIST